MDQDPEVIAPRSGGEPFDVAPVRLTPRTIDEVREASRPRSPTDAELSISIPRLTWAKHRKGLVWSVVALVAIGVLVGAVLWPTSTRWTLVANPAPQWGELSTLTCSTANTCLASTGDQMLSLTDRGAAWTPSGNAISAFDRILGTSCDTYECSVASENGGEWSSGDGGQDFTGGTSTDPGSIPSSEFPMVHDSTAGYEYGGEGLSCSPSGSLCLTMVSTTNVSRHGRSGNGSFVRTEAQCENPGRYPSVECTDGLTTSYQYFPGSLGAPLTPDCVTASVCWAIGTGVEDSVWRTTDAGRTWSGFVLPDLMRDQPLTIDSISCASATACAVGDDSSDVFFTTNAGRSWREETIAVWPASPEPCSGDTSFCGGGSLEDEPVSALYCWSAAHCLAGSSGTGNISWQTGSNPPSSLQFGDGAIAATTDGGKTWTAESIPGGVEVDAVSCTHPDSCWAVGETTSSGKSPTGVILHTSSP